MEPQSTRYPNSAGATLGGCSKTFIFFIQILFTNSHFWASGPTTGFGTLPVPFRQAVQNLHIFCSILCHIVFFASGLCGCFGSLPDESGRGARGVVLRSAKPRSNPLICRLYALRSKSDTPGAIRRSVVCLGCAMDPAEYQRPSVKSVDLLCDLFVLLSFSEIPFPRCNPLIYGLQTTEPFPEPPLSFPSRGPPWGIPSTPQSVHVFPVLLGTHAVANVLQLLHLPRFPFHDSTGFQFCYKTY